MLRCAVLWCSEDDVARARNQLKASILFSQDGTTGVAEDIGWVLPAIPAF